VPAITRAEVVAEGREVVGRVAAGVVHDMSNLVQVVELEARRLLDVADDSALVQEHATAILDANRRAYVLIQRVLSLRGDPRHNPMNIDARGHLERIAEALARTLSPRNMLCVDLSSGLGRVRFDPSQLEQVVIHLVTNARAASMPGASIDLRASQVTQQKAETGKPAGTYCLVEVVDRGRGMSSEETRRAPEAFYTTRPDRGVGLGLTIAHELIESYGGRLELHSAPSDGTRARVYLPSCI